MADGRLTTPRTPQEWTRLRRLRVVASAEHVDADLHGESVILQLRTRRFHGLDGVGARIWQLLKTPITVAALTEAIVREYDVTPDRCETDLVALLVELDSAGLIEVSDGDAG